MNNKKSTRPLSEAETPQVFAVEMKDGAAKFTRRDFLKAAGIATTASVIACKALDPSKMATAVPSATSTKFPTSTDIPTDTPNAEPSLTPQPTLSEGEIRQVCTGVRAHSDTVFKIIFTPDSKLMVTLAKDAKLWSLPEGSFLKTLVSEVQYRSGPKGVALSPDGNHLLAYGYQGQLFSMREGVMQARNWDVMTDAVAFTADGQSVIASDTVNQTITIWSFPGLSLLRTLAGSLSSTLLVSPDDKYLITGGSEGESFRIWSLPEGNLVSKVPGPAMRNPVVTPDGTLLTGSTRDQIVRLWSLPDGKLFKNLTGHTDRVHAVAISPDGRLLISGSDDKNLKIWSLPDGKLQTTIANSVWVRLLEIQNDGSLMAVENGRDISLYSLPDGHFIRNLQGFPDYSFETISISPDGRFLVASANNKHVNLWSLPDGELRTCLLDLGANSSSVRGTTSQIKNAAGETIEYTLPCGIPIPPGAVCTCNCVAGSYVPPCDCVSFSTHYWYPN